MADDGVRDYAARRAQFKKALDAETGARNRNEHAIKIRKDKRAQQEQAKRLQLMRSAAASDAPAIPLSHMTQAQFAALVRDVYGGDEAKALEATCQFRKMLSSEKHPPIEQVMQLNVASKFVEFLRYAHNTQLQFEAAWALTNIASGTSAQTRYVLELGAVPFFVALLDSPSPDVREQAVWALGNIAGDSPEFRDEVIAAGAIVPLVRQMNHLAPLCFVRNGMWAISNLCRGKPPATFDKVAPLLPTLAAAIYSGDKEILIDALWTLSYMSDGDNVRVQTCLEAGITQRVVQLLVHSESAVQVPALRTVGNIVTGDEIQTQLAINAGALPCLLMLLQNGRKAVKKEAAWTISNIMAGTRDQIKAVIECNIVHAIISLMHGADYDIRKEAVWCISNATSGGSPDQLAFLVRCGCIPPLVDVLTLEHDAKMVTVALEGLENILKSGDVKFRVGDAPGAVNPYVEMCSNAGMTWNLEVLLSCPNKTLLEKSGALLVKYFPREDAGGVDDYYDDEDDGGYADPTDAVAAGGGGGGALVPQTFAFGVPQQQPQYPQQYPQQQQQQPQQQFGQAPHFGYAAPPGHAMPAPAFGAAPPQPPPQAGGGGGGPMQFAFEFH